MIAEHGRLDRRFTILRGKRAGAFDRDQYYLEQAVRARIARKFRQYLREMRPVHLIVPRWGAATAFLDEGGIDVQIGHPSVRCRLLSLEPLEGRPATQAWAWMCHALADLAGEAAPSVPDEGAFAAELGHLFAKLDEGPPACLIMHDIDAVDPEALQRLITVFARHDERRQRRAGFNLVLCGPPGLPAVPEVDLVEPPFERMTLLDYDRAEAVALLASFVGADDPEVLRAIVDRVGGVPDMLHALTRLPRHQLPRLPQHTTAMWSALGALGSEIRGTVQIMLSDAVLAERLRALAEQGTLDHVPGRDSALVAAGLVEVRRRAALRARVTGVDEAPWTREPQAALRSSLFAELIQAG